MFKEIRAATIICEICGQLLFPGSPFRWAGEYRRRIEYPRLSAVDCFFQAETMAGRKNRKTARRKSKGPERGLCHFGSS